MDQLKQIWKKKGSCRSYAEFVKEQSGQSIEEILMSDVIEYHCPGIDLAAEKVLEASKIGTPIYVVVDYDADGIDAGAIMHMILKRLSKDYRIIVPKRRKDGYGINPDMIKDAPDGSLVITVDNGITAVDAIRYAKKKNMTVVIMDHHEKQAVVPDADVIVDPEAFPDGWTFTHYCGAGLAFKLAEYLFPNDQDFLDAASCFAAIATIGDSVNVTGENRNIIKRGLKNINTGKCTQGLQALLQYIRENGKVEVFGVYEVAFKIAPMINAPGRLSDDGGKLVLTSMFSCGEKAKDNAKEIFDLNEKRKTMVEEAIEGSSPRGENIAFLYDPTIEEGLCGIIAGHMSSDLHKPAFVMTKTEDGFIKGSGRCEDDYNIFLAMHDLTFLTRFGGHQCAVGFSLMEQDVELLFTALEAAFPEGKTENISYYDFTATPADLYNIYIDINRIEVYGAGLPNPVICVKTRIKDPRPTKDGKHLMFQADSVKAIGFGLAEKYQELGNPQTAYVYGTLSTNWWKGRPSMQMQVDDLEVFFTA